MNATAKPLLKLTANDLMSRDVVMLPKDMSLRAAAHLLAQNQISGAPVVDAEGRCIGVVSATDFVRWAEKGKHAARPEPTESNCHCAWQLVDAAELPPDQVGAHMTCDPVMVSPQTSIMVLARLMLDAHIHRVVVADDHHRPVGIVSSTDLLAAIAHADPTSMNRLESTASLRNAAESHTQSGQRIGHGPNYATRPVRS
jgi:CBS domain-containing protein